MSTRHRGPSILGQLSQAHDKFNFFGPTLSFPNKFGKNQAPCKKPQPPHFSIKWTFHLTWRGLTNRVYKKTCQNCLNSLKILTHSQSTEKKKKRQEIVFLGFNYFLVYFDQKTNFFLTRSELSLPTQFFEPSSYYKHLLFIIHRDSTEGLVKHFYTCLQEEVWVTSINHTLLFSSFFYVCQKYIEP